MKQKIVNIIGVVIPIVLLLILSGSFIKSMKRAKDAKQLIQRTEDKLEKVEEEAEKLQSQLEITQSEQFIEEQLRDKLGLAKEGEIVLVLPDNETLKKLAPIIPEEEEIKPLPNWKKWLNLFM